MWKFKLNEYHFVDHSKESFERPKIFQKLRHSDDIRKKSSKKLSRKIRFFKTRVIFQGVMESGHEFYKDTTIDTNFMVSKGEESRSVVLTRVRERKKKKKHPSEIYSVQGL